MEDNASEIEKKIRSNDINECSDRELISFLVRKFLESSDGIASMEKTTMKLDESLKGLHDSVSRLERDVDEIHSSQNNGITSLDIVAASLTQGATLEKGQQYNRFSSGNSKKMDVLSQLNIGL